MIIIYVQSNGHMLHAWITSHIPMFSLNMTVAEVEKENSVKQKQVRSLTSILVHVYWVIVLPGF